jgi:hypothetical protein
MKQLPEFNLGISIPLKIRATKHAGASHRSQQIHLTAESAFWVLSAISGYMSCIPYFGDL